MIMVKNNDELDAERAKADADNRERLGKGQEEIVSSISSHVLNAWRTVKDAKKETQEGLIGNLEQRMGEYSQEAKAIISKVGGSDIYFRATSTKCNAAEAWLKDIMNDPANRCWSLAPTPEPELSPEIKNFIVEHTTNVFMNEVMAGFPPQDPQEIYDYANELKEEIREEEDEKANDASSRMEDVIEDQLIDAKFYSVLDDFISNLCTYKFAVIKGPVMHRVKKLIWEKSPEGKLSPAVIEEVEQRFECVSPMDIYFSPKMVDINSGYVIERQDVERHELAGMRGIEGYDTDAINEALMNQTGNTATFDSIDDWRIQELVNRNTESDKKHETTIELLHYYGHIKGETLSEYGLEVEDIADSYDTWVIMAGEHVIKAEINPDFMGRRPYYVTSFEKVPGSLIGFGVPDKMKDLQQLINGNMRALANNMSFGSGPQTIINNALLDASEKITSIKPYKIWQYSDETGMKGVPVTFFHPEMYSQELIGIYLKLKDEIDETTGIPRYMYGDQRVGGAGSTARGLSMLMNAATKVMKQVVRNCDMDIFQPLINRMYEYNMIYNEDDTIKGDLRVIPKGAMALIVKEQTQTARAEALANTNNPVDMEIIGLEGRAEMLRENLKSLDIPIDKIIPSREKLLRKKEQQEMQMQEQHQMQNQLQLQVPPQQQEQIAVNQ